MELREGITYFKKKYSRPYCHTEATHIYVLGNRKHIPIQKFGSTTSKGMESLDWNSFGRGAGTQLSSVGTGEC